jgi:hypothetical protein
MRLFQNFSFGTATLDLREKAGFRPLFLRACGKTMGFWNRLKYYYCYYSQLKIAKHPPLLIDSN